MYTQIFEDETYDTLIPDYHIREKQQLEEMENIKISWINWLKKNSIGYEIIKNEPFHFMVKVNGKHSIVDDKLRWANNKYFSEITLKQILKKSTEWIQKYFKPEVKKEPQLEQYFHFDIGVFQLSDITNKEKLLLCIISEFKECWITNKTLADYMGIKSQVSISKKVNNLIKKGYLKAKYIRNGNQTQNRVLTMAKDWKIGKYVTIPVNQFKIVKDQLQLIIETYQSGLDKKISNNQIATLFGISKRAVIGKKTSGEKTDKGMNKKEVFIIGSEKMDNGEKTDNMGVKKQIITQCKNIYGGGEKMDNEGVKKHIRYIILNNILYNKLYIKHYNRILKKVWLYNKMINWNKRGFIKNTVLEGNNSEDRIDNTDYMMDYIVNQYEKKLSIKEKQIEQIKGNNNLTGLEKSTPAPRTFDEMMESLPDPVF